MIIAEDLVLLLYADATGKAVVGRTKLDYALAGALLGDLANAGRVDVAAGRLVVRDPTPLGDDILDGALTFLAGKQGKKPDDVLDPLDNGLRDRLLNRLADRGILERQDRRIFGLLPPSRWPAADVRHEAEVRAKLDAVLRHGESPDPRTHMLIAILAAINAITKVIESPDEGDLKSRAKSLAQGVWPADAVRKAQRDELVTTSSMSCLAERPS